jgi:hypothetical protein
VVEAVVSKGIDSLESGARVPIVSESELSPLGLNSHVKSELPLKKGSNLSLK